MNDLFLGVVSDFFKLISISINEFPVQMDINETTKIQFECQDEHLVIISSKSNIRDVEDILIKSLGNCFFKNQEKYSLQVCLQQDDSLSFFVILEQSQVAVPMIDNIVNKLIELHRDDT